MSPWLYGEKLVTSVFMLMLVLHFALFLFCFMRKQRFHAALLFHPLSRLWGSLFVVLPAILILFSPTPIAANLHAPVRICVPLHNKTPADAERTEAEDTASLCLLLSQPEGAVFAPVLEITSALHRVCVCCVCSMRKASSIAPRCPRQSCGSALQGSSHTRRPAGTQQLPACACREGGPDLHPSSCLAERQREKELGAKHEPTSFQVSIWQDRGSFDQAGEAQSLCPLPAWRTEFVAGYPPESGRARATAVTCCDSISRRPRMTFLRRVGSMMEPQNTPRRKWLEAEVVSVT